MANKTRRTRSTMIALRFDNASAAKAALAHLLESRPKTFGDKIVRSASKIEVPEELLRKAKNSLTQEDIEFEVEANEEAAPRRAVTKKAAKRIATKRATKKAGAKKRVRKEREPSEVVDKKPRSKKAGAKKAPKRPMMDKQRAGDVVEKLGTGRRPAKKPVAVLYTVLLPGPSDAKKMLSAMMEAEEFSTHKRDGARIVVGTAIDEKTLVSLIKATAKELDIQYVLESGFGDAYLRLSKKIIGDAGKGKKSKADKFVAREKAPWWKVKLDSSTLAAVSYNPLTSKLIVTFNKGSRYRYSDVSVEEFIMLTTAESHGTWFTSNIKSTKKFVELEAA